MDSRGIFHRRNRDLNTKPLTGLPSFEPPRLNYNTDTNSSSSSSDEFPKLVFEKHSSLRKSNSFRASTLKKKVSFNSNQLKSIKKKQIKSKFYTIENKSNSKLKCLEIFQ